ncbi:hypothetical protein BD770DRAFT_390950 [Pilaira anomala]|nr:hypothetical protein BD770DRAFT_390950 [Pilaira anomala]
MLLSMKTLFFFFSKPVNGEVVVSDEQSNWRKRNVAQIWCTSQLPILFERKRKVKKEEKVVNINQFIMYPVCVCSFWKSTCSFSMGSMLLSFLCLRNYQ